MEILGKQNSKKISALVTAIRTSTSSNPHEFPITAIKKYMNKIDSFGLTRKQVSDLVVNAKFGDPIVYGIFALCCPNIFHERQSDSGLRLFFERKDTQAIVITVMYVI